MSNYMTERPRRLRGSENIRCLTQETMLTPADLVWPVFVKDGSKKKEPIEAMPGCFHWSKDELIKELSSLSKLGLKAVALFPVIDSKLKDDRGSESFNPSGLIPRVVRDIKSNLPEMMVITDVALDPYSSMGHDGLVKNGEVVNDDTLFVLAEQAIIHARAGADFVAPSDMMDGRVAFIRRRLDEDGFQNTGIISYCAKYASNFYGPFRQALDSAPKVGNKKSYQMNPANRREALREARLDQAEGADILMIKPAISYLDIVREMRNSSDLPIAAFNVSGEYAMVKAAAANKWIQERETVEEILLSIKRAGADMIFSYHTPEVLRYPAPIVKT